MTGFGDSIYEKGMRTGEQNGMQIGMQKEYNKDVMRE